MATVRWVNAPEVQIVKRSTPKRRFLVYLCKSGADKCPVFETSLSSRKFDLAVRYYDKPSEGDRHLSAAEYVLTGGLSKFHSAHLFIDREQIADRYDGMIFLDDDIEVTVDQINDFLVLADALKLDLAQPALTHDSYSSWQITLCHPSFMWRKTNFVEVMMPFISRRAMTVLLPSFSQSVSSYGLDLLWPHLLAQIDGNIGILDAIVVGHRRPIDRENGGFYTYIKSLGIDPAEERRKLLLSYGVKKLQPRTLSAVHKHEVPTILRKRIYSKNAVLKRISLRLAGLSTKQPKTEFISE